MYQYDFFSHLPLSYQKVNITLSFSSSRHFVQPTLGKAWWSRGAGLTSHHIMMKGNPAIRIEHRDPQREDRTRKEKKATVR